MQKQTEKKESPLASRMRPETLDEIVGQEHILGPDRLLSRAIKADKLTSLIFYGPPGTGKTTLAQVIANTTKADFRELNATTSGKKDMEEAVARAKENARMYGKRTILFIDEIHRFNKAQQDYLLPFVEDGTVILIGATTENPYFEVNRALVSRSRVFELYKLTREEIKTLIRRALTDEEKGLGSFHARMDEDALSFLSDTANGDARTALSALELGVMTTDPGEDGVIHLTLPVISECVQRRAIRYDRDGEDHYNTISAFIKSMRGSDPQAAVYYLARMLYAGEDIKFIARRIMICAAEDVGMADPNAICVASAACEIVERVGLPEARIPLAEAAVYVATAPKSNAAYKAIDAALDYVKTHESGEVPLHLRNLHFGDQKELGEAIIYKYAHDYPHHWVDQQYLPDGAKDEVFYVPGENGYEKSVRSYMEQIESWRKDHRVDEPDPEAEGCPKQKQNRRKDV